MSCFESVELRLPHRPPYPQPHQLATSWLSDSCALWALTSPIFRSAVPTGFAWIPAAMMAFATGGWEARTHHLQSDCTPWRLACIGTLQKGQVNEH